MARNYGHGRLREKGYKMADTNITIPDLGSLTAGQLNDLLLVTRGTTGYKMLVSDIAKTIIETYAGSSLAGSTQSVKSALDAINSKMVIGVGRESLSNTVVYNAYGWISGNAKNLYLFIPLNFISNVSTVSFNSLRVGLRLSTGGYAFGADSFDVTSMVALAQIKRFEGGVLVNINSDTAICDTNNICCAGTARFTAVFS